MVCRGFPAAYVGLYAQLRDVAITNGYALAIHGSLARDMDLLAVPWTEHAIDAEELILKFVETLGLNVDEGITLLSPTNEICNGVKPHGRLAWNIMLGNNAYIDISITPRHCNKLDTEVTMDACGIPEGETND